MTDFEIGDRVSEAFYGVGTVLNVKEDGMLVIDFDDYPQFRNMHSCMCSLAVE